MEGESQCDGESAGFLSVGGAGAGLEVVPRGAEEWMVVEIVSKCR